VPSANSNAVTKIPKTANSDLTIYDLNLGSVGETRRKSANLALPEAEKVVGSKHRILSGQVVI
jgi:hypothetical protein